MHSSSFDIPNELEAREHTVRARELSLEVADFGEAQESGLEAREFNFDAGEQNVKAKERHIEAGEQNIEALNILTPVLNPEEIYQDYHLELDGQICDEYGQFLDPDTPPPPFITREHGDWTLFCDRTEFETAQFLYTKNQMSGGDIDTHMYLWGRTLANHRDTPPFTDHKDLYSTINAIPLGEVAWETSTMKFNEKTPNPSDPGTCAPWMDTPYTAWFRDPHAVVRNMLANPDFRDEMDYTPYREWKGEGDNAKQQWRNVMSGDWAWNQADEIAKDLETHGSTFVPVLLRSDKTMVSVTTGPNDYYPFYTLIGNVHNNVWHAHCNAIAVVRFLAIPKTVKEYVDDAHFHKLKKQLFHSSLSQILRSFKTFMTVPEVVHFGDGHFRHVIYGLGPYITDYPEQVVLSCIVSNWCAKCFAFPTDLDGKDAQLRAQEVMDVLCDNVDFGTLWYQWGVDADIVPFTNDYPHTDIHELISPDILHQLILIKGTFKDHLVVWVKKYLECIHGKTCAKAVMDDIDRRIAAVPSFAGLRRFPQGCGFTQWTGNDSKALMKVYLPAMEGYVPDDVVRCFHAFLEFYDTLKEIKEALDHFHHYHKVFQETGVCFDGFSLPRQHSLMHYTELIRMFGAPNGVCLSIMESKHIKAVSVNAENDNRNIEGSGKADDRSKADDRGEVDDGECKRASTIHALAEELDVPNLPQLVRLFLYDQHLADDKHTSDTVLLTACPRFQGRIKVFGSAAATFFAPSDPSGIGGMQREYICSVPSWRGGPGRYDTVFMNTGSKDGMHGMEVARVLCFFPSIFLCALVHWFKLVFDEPNPGNGMWMVKPSFLDLELNTQELSIIHIDMIIRATHLLPIFSKGCVPQKATFHETLDTYRRFYVNKFADHHSFEIVS
ncbi:hypothetical protein BDR03DRAFT_932487 [Suillus americanus]|nr:hypothetical protein BDR03DRAFT_932487 [Suillus americanus]